MSPADFLREIVQPNRADLEADYGSLRKGFNAIAAVDALAAQLFEWLRTERPDLVVAGEDDTQFRARLAMKSRDFQIVRDMAKAQKHVRLERMKPLVGHSDQIAAKSLGWGEMKWGEGRWGGPPQVVVKLDDGTLEYVETILDRAVAFLEDELRSSGALT